MLAILCACNASEKKESAQAVIPTPTGLQGLQKSNVVQPVAQQTKSNLIFNPPHGEAGHSCALAVGAPLTLQQKCSINKIQIHIQHLPQRRLL